VVLAPTLLAPPRGRNALAVVVHDAVPWTHPETLTARGVAFHRRIAGRVAREADAVLVPTHATALALRDALPLDSARVHVVGAGVSAAAVTPPPDAAARRRRLGLPPSYALTVATLEPRKGLDVLLDALALGDAGLPVLVAGPPGWGGVDLAAEAAGRGLDDDRVRALGRLPDPDLAAVLTGASLLVAPSRAEGFGLPVLEAMAAGVPVLSSDAAALVEVGGGATVTVPVGDAAALAAALRELAGDPQRRAELARQGLSRAAEYAWDRTATRVWSILAVLPGGGGTGA